MSNRPSTRNKNKRQRPDNNAEVISELYRKIHLSGEVTKDDIKQLYMFGKPVCNQGCRINTKDNPNCFCGLIPPPNGNRKSGLWQKTSEIVSSLGPDPSKDLRDSFDTPAGLTNLGATCYANSILQFLYMNKPFREGVLSVEPDVLAKQPVLGQLARLFAQLHTSKMAFVDSAPFIEALALDNGIQQDSHEFLTLLFSLLEQCLSYSKVSKARTVVQDLFRGGVSHVTKCSKCGNQSEASSNVEDFYGVELNVKGLKSLDESLDDYLSVEELQGDNQYFCYSCATRVNATRSIRLQSLPPVLIFQLKRCVFLPNTTTKKKITSAFCFPGEVDMARWLSDQSKSKLIYDLSAVLIHKGSAVNSGHYVAHIKDQDTGLWWEFDDEIVSDMGQHPFGGNSSNVAAKSLQNIPAGQSCFSEPDGVVNGNHVNTSGLHASSPETTSNVQTFSSSDAYMLMYCLRHQTNGHRKAQLGSGGGILKDGNSISLQTDAYLPSHLMKEVNELNKSYLESCQQYKTKKEAKLALIAERRQEVRSVISEASVQSSVESFWWISVDWLRQWADTITPTIIDNTPIQCLHGKVPVSKISSMKRLSAKAWNTISSKYKGGPELGEDDCCIVCLKETACAAVSADSYRDGRTSMRELAEAALAGKCPDGPLYYVSKAWLSQWVRRRNIDSPCEADTGPTASIRCPHGALMPEQAAGARRALIPEILWVFIFNSANEVKPDDTVGCSVFASDSETCSQCCIDLSEVTCMEDNLRDFKLKQRQSHEKLAIGKSIPLFPRNKYYLLPTSWLSKWRCYIMAGGKNASSTAEPDNLNSAIESLKCEQHSRLLRRPPDLMRKRGAILQKAPSVDELTIITENDWTSFCKDWNGIEEKGISAEIDSTNSAEDCLLGTLEEMPITEENVNSLDDANGETESQGPIIKTYPEVCEDCIGERESFELVRKLNYCNEDICICFVRGKEPPKYILEGSANILEPNRRISKRSRRTSYGNSVNLNVSGSTTLYELKMMIWQSFGIVKENQILHKGSKIVDGETATLADMCIFPGDVLWVTDSEIHENRDIAEELSDTKMEVQQSEGGFRGTLLTSNIPPTQVMSQGCFN
ncbi:ubiquitin carboxyl-terminal hydrolase 26 isoform X1 [Cynara cardunculus var. scolymus]|uniref:ubiquitin carboxyl-terminal hydrolase 26 isoform X1 n=1 Tax=Cynara cardunculus var. scolymus TaxID=59895 RepID=UPI000D62E81D|nr:ubiquitin carboxyl-terminal hydrolase 26 isoform X1 [Cynara cardunculus var. scolymus]XP_024995809.1 ubiquitin carboxyl-terminal hydrolase 26 isoform X1 [Cynara cardunculus var. scolymus]